MAFDCFGLCAPQEEDLEAAERQPLLPQYQDDTTLQRQLHQKLHTYQMLRALGQGYMPTNEQAITNLRTLLASGLLNADSDEELSDSGRAAVHWGREWIKQIIQLLQHKNADDQIQDFVWYLAKARVNVDIGDVVATAGRAQKKANTAAAYRSLQTVGSLLLTNSDFRLFVSDLGTIGREVFTDTAFAIADASKEAGKRLEPSQQEQQALKEPNGDSKPAPSNADLKEGVSDVAEVLQESAGKVIGEAGRSVADKVQGDEKDTLLYRLKQAVVKLRKRQDYSDSVSTLALLLKRYAMVYSHVVADTVETAERDISINDETDLAVRNFWQFLTSFGNKKQWSELEERFRALMEHGKTDPQFDELIRQLGNALQELLTDPEFFDHAEDRFQRLRKQSEKLATGSPLRSDLDGFLAKVQSTWHSVVSDTDIAALLKTTTRLAKVLSPAQAYANPDLVADSIHIFTPLLIHAIQYLPIPRLELATPDIDLLLENLILEPGHTVNNSSFLPYRLAIETLSGLEVRKARFRTTSAAKSLVSVRLDGLSLAASEVGFWYRLHSGPLLRFIDQGIASFALDERGIDVAIEMEIGRDSLEALLTLRNVRVKIHRLNYTLRKSKFSFLAWIFKPLIRPIVKRALEVKIASAVAEASHFANRELLYARERLRAARIAGPEDMWSFVKAVAARLVPEEDPDLYTRVGVAQPGQGVFKGVYAPGSVVKVWNEEAAKAKDRVREYERQGWRNDIFDVQTVMMG